MDIFDGLSALGGLCLFLFGMSIMAEALQRRAGGRLGGQLRRMTRSRWAGFFTGLAVTAAVQSSSAAMVMVVGFVNSGLLTLGQAVGVIMGTNVGTTVTPWLLSLGGLEGGGFPGRLLRPAGFVPLLSLWGIIAYLSRNGRRRDTGQALLGFATLMQGMELMSGSVAGLAQAEGFRRLFTAFTDPLLGLLAGALLCPSLWGRTSAPASRPCCPPWGPAAMPAGRRWSTCCSTLPGPGCGWRCSGW